MLPRNGEVNHHNCLILAAALQNLVITLNNIYIFLVRITLYKVNDLSCVQCKKCIQDTDDAGDQSYLITK